MMTDLLTEIEGCMAILKIGPHRFGILACGNGRVVERLRAGRPVLTTTEERIRAFIARTKVAATEVSAS